MPVHSRHRRPPALEGCLEGTPRQWRSRWVLLPQWAPPPERLDRFLHWKRKRKGKKREKNTKPANQRNKKRNKKHKLKLLSIGEVITYEGIKHGANILQRLLWQNLLTRESVWLCSLPQSSWGAGASEGTILLEEGVHRARRERKESVSRWNTEPATKRLEVKHDLQQVSCVPSGSVFYMKNGNLKQARSLKSSQQWENAWIVLFSEDHQN